MKRASSIASLATLVAIAGCEEARSPSREPLAAPSAPAPPSDPGRARLERIITASGPAHLRDGCVAASVWSLVDAPEAGALLDRLVASYASTRTLTARDDVACYPAAVNGRLVRKWRTGELDVAAELRNPNPRARGAVIVLLAQAHARPEAIRAALGDPEFTVRMRAFTAVADTKDREAEPQLDAIVARVPPDAPGEKNPSPERATATRERRWACTTLAALRGTNPCPEMSDGGGGLLLSGPGPAPDRCGTLRADLAAPDPNVLTRALHIILNERARPLTRPFDPLLAGTEAPPGCPITDAELEPLLAHAEPVVRSLAAAALIAPRHPALPTTADALTRRPRQP